MSKLQKTDLMKLKSEHEKTDRVVNSSKNIEKELLDILRDHEEIRLDKLSDIVNADKESVMKKCKTLENLNVIRIKYPLLGEPIIKRGKGFNIKETTRLTQDYTEKEIS